MVLDKDLKELEENCCLSLKEVACLGRIKREVGSAVQGADCVLTYPGCTEALISSAAR